VVERLLPWSFVAVGLVSGWFFTVEPWGRIQAGTVNDPDTAQTLGVVFGVISALFIVGGVGMIIHRARAKKRT
jgi:prolipoprotein diacylglyceryltransferase